MNGKKAKQLKQMCKELGHWKKESERVVVKETKKFAHIVKADGSTSLREVVQKTIVNKSRVAYRKAKQAYKNGEFTIG